ncbi:hypothetical protein UPYG_G00004550 [Umbra pygmaea]|uniref:Uncharacterized protein n=1 Tax=Umbra pygmaea TaxID=75934 RepID=A0ABD0XH54_UMBPY
MTSVRRTQTLEKFFRTMWPDDSFRSRSCAHPAVLVPKSLLLVITFPPGDSSCTPPESNAFSLPNATKLC